MEHKRKHHSLANDLLEARAKYPNDPHLMDAVIAYLSHSLPACKNLDHHLCQRVISSHAGYKQKQQDDNE